MADEARAVDEARAGELILVRHGQTEWSVAGRHTGVTDIPLTAEGEEQARRVGGFLRKRPRPSLVLVSPRRRARRTAALAGLTDAPPDLPAGLVADTRIVDELVEWDYGGYEGRTTAEISADLGKPWTIWADGAVPGATPGETLEQVARRAGAAIDQARPTLAAGGDVVMVAHGHLLRVLAAVWLELEPSAGAHLILSAGSVNVLGAEHAVPALALWNHVPD
ncbi:MAG: histidine phosphatase family protein [Frankia sp.]